MREHRYDKLGQHKGDHERLLDEIRDIMDGFEGHEDIESAKLARRLDAWFSRHLDTHGARLHKALKTHPH